MIQEQTILHYDQPRILAHYPLVRLGELIERRPQYVGLEPERLYALVTVRRKGQGAELRQRRTGAQIRANRMLRIISGQLILSRLDASQGAVAIVPPDLHGAVVSHDFPSYHVDHRRVRPDFLVWALTRRRSLETLTSISEGKGKRRRVNLNKLSELLIPLPPFRKQIGMMKQPVQ